MAYQETPAGVTIRPVSDTDIPAVTEIYAHHVLHGKASFEETPPTQEEMQRRSNDLINGGYPYLVAERGGVVAGYAYAGPYRTRPAYRFSVENSVYVADGQSGAGIGSALLTEIIRLCEERGFRQMIAIIGDSGNEGSIALHARCGFVHAGTLKSVGFKHGGWLDSVIMQRSLGNGDKTLPQE